MILAAGFGSRLKPLTLSLPKPMFPVLNRPLLEHVLNYLSSQGIQDIIVNVHHLPDKIVEYFGVCSFPGKKKFWEPQEDSKRPSPSLKKKRF